MPVKSDREYRLFTLNGFETRREENGDLWVEGYATTFNQEYLLYSDADYEVWESVDARAFEGADMSDVIMQYDHQGRVFARNKNSTLFLTPDEHGMKTRANLGHTDIGRQLFEEIDGGYTTQMSYGYSVREQTRTVDRNEETGKTIVHRIVRRIKKLYDVSAVSLPANPNTEIFSARSFGEGVIAEIEEERQALEARRKKAQKIRIMMEMEDLKNDDH